MIAGYEGAALLAAFDRLSAAIAGSNLQVVQSAPSTVPANINKAANVGRVNAATTRPVPAVEPMLMTAPPDNAKAIARKALARSLLAPSTVAVGSQLIEHFNLHTGRCDPGIASLAAKVGVAPRSVRRAVAGLVGAGLFGVVRHGGRNHANAYQPNWSVMVRLAGEGDLVATRPVLSADPANSVRQNHSQKPNSDSMMGRAPRKRQARAPDGRQGFLPLPIAGGREKAEEAVRAKLFSQLDGHLRATFLPSDKAGFTEGLIRSLSIGPAWQAAITAEMRRHGDGLTVLLQAIDALGEGRMGFGGSGR